LAFEEEAAHEGPLPGGREEAGIEEGDLHLVSVDLHLPLPAPRRRGRFGAGRTLDQPRRKFVYPGLARGPPTRHATAEEPHEPPKSLSHPRLRHPPARPKDRARRTEEPTPRMGAPGRVRGRGRVARRSRRPRGEGGDRSRGAAGGTVLHLRRPRTGATDAQQLEHRHLAIRRITGWGLQRL